MADENDNDAGSGDGAGEGSEGDGKKSPGKQMREKLETTLAENVELKGKLLVHEAGLSHLTPKQRNAAIRDATEDGAELTVDSLKKSANELGFPEQPKQTTNGEGDKDGDKAKDDGEGNEPDPETGLEAIEMAQRRVPTTPADGSFEQKIANAKSQEEVEALIRSEGHKQGIVLEADIE